MEEILAVLKKMDGRLMDIAADLRWFRQREQRKLDDLAKSSRDMKGESERRYSPANLSLSPERISPADGVSVASEPAPSKCSIDQV